MKRAQKNLLTLQVVIFKSWEVFDTEHLFPSSRLKDWTEEKNEDLKRKIISRIEKHQIYILAVACDTLEYKTFDHPLSFLLIQKLNCQIYRIVQCIYE